EIFGLSYRSRVLPQRCRRASEQAARQIEGRLWGIYRLPCFLNRHGRLDWNVWGTHMAGTFAKVTAIGGLPVLVAGIALPRPAGPCFPDLESRNPNRLRLISLRLARTRGGADPRVGRLAG